LSQPRQLHLRRVARVFRLKVDHPPHARTGRAVHQGVRTFEDLNAIDHLGIHNLARQHAGKAAKGHVVATVSDNRQELIQKMQAGRIRGLIVIPVDFDARMARPNDTAPIQVITDGSEPNTANFVQGYAEGIWQLWQMQRAEDRGETFEPLIDVQTRYWFNPAAISQHFIIPGAVTIIMTVIGAILTSLVIAREWERGTMEALLSTEVTRTELLLCKLIPQNSRSPGSGLHRRRRNHHRPAGSGYC
jgi:hypothetical protein